MEGEVQPVQALVGGLIIGSSVLWGARMLGKVTGISGALRRSFSKSGDPEVAGSRALVGGLLASGAIARLALGERVLTGILKGGSGMWEMVPRQFLGGVLVGLGSTMANGCTSGHGVCGLGRLSVRSLVSVLTFMGAASITVHSTGTLGFLRAKAPFQISLPTNSALGWLPVSVLTMVAPPLLKTIGKALGIKQAENPSETAIRAVTGLTFGMGLILSRMVDPAVVAGFLVGPWAPGFDPSLLGVLGGAVMVSLIAFQGNRASQNQIIDANLICGSAVFGIGWGLIGMCPGPAIVSLGLSLYHNPAIIAACTGMLVGTGAATQLAK